MSTTGIYGFYKSEEFKVTYNHYFSSLEILGLSITEFVKSNSINELNRICDRIIMVDEFINPTELQISEFKEYINPDDFSNEITWNNLLFKYRGDLSAYEKETRFMIDSSFVRNTPSCEWAYIINLDTDSLEIYFDNSPLIDGIPLFEVSTDAIELLISEFNTIQRIKNTYPKEQINYIIDKLKSLEYKNNNF